MKKRYLVIITTIVMIASLFPKGVRSQVCECEGNSWTIYYDEETFKFDTIFFFYYRTPDGLERKILDAIATESFQIKNGVLYLKGRPAGENDIPEKSAIFCLESEKFLLNGNCVFCFNCEQKHWEKANLNPHDFLCLLDNQ